MTERSKLAKEVNGLLPAEGSNLNYRGNFNIETKKEHFAIFFHKKSKALEAMELLSKKGLNVEFCKTPNYINYYFKFYILITL